MFKTCKRAHSYSATIRQCPICNKASQDQWRAKNSDIALERAISWQKNNYKRAYANRKAYLQRNPGLAAFYCASRRAVTLQATPHWANLKEIRAFYLGCPSGLEVDHIVPIQGKTASGLHVLANLQYLKTSENRRKSNKLNG